MDKANASLQKLSLEAEEAAKQEAEAEENAVEPDASCPDGPYEVLQIHKTTHAWFIPATTHALRYVRIPAVDS